MFGWLRRRATASSSHEPVAPAEASEPSEPSEASEPTEPATPTAAAPTGTPLAPLPDLPRRDPAPLTPPQRAAAAARFAAADAARRRGDSAAAIAELQATIAIDPDHGEAHNNLGGLLRDAGRDDEALAAFREAVRARPKLAFAWFNLGTMLRDRGRLEEAIAALERSVALDPKQADAHYWIGNALMGRGDSAGALAAYRSAVRLDRRLLKARWALTMAQIVPVPESVAAEDASRAAFAAELDKLATWCRTNRPADAFQSVGATQPYYLAYQARSNRDLLEGYGRLCVELMRPWEAKVGLPAAQPPRGAKCRVGIVSAHFQNHSVWNALVRGWLAHLDRSRIELHLFHIAPHQDAETAFARSRAHRFESAPCDWSAWAKAIVDSRLDAVVYPEVGMDAVTAKLAAARLAPVQLATWGHPETTGLPSIDHYLSAAAMEPADAAAHYTEHLAMLPGLGCCARRYGTAPARIDLRSLGLPAGRPILLCPGVPFKYAPGHDAVWVEIARRSGGVLVFFKGGPDLLAGRLEARLRRAFAEAGVDFDRHVVFIPWQGQAAFFGLMKAADLSLDSPGFSGFNTAMQAVEAGMPMVAFEGEFLRGRFASGVLRELGLGDCVASTPAAYVDAVVALLADGGRRQRLRSDIERRGKTLFENTDSVAALQRFLLEVGGQQG